MNRGTVHVRLFKDAVEALEKAASALEHERRVEEWGFPDIKTGINLNCEVRRYEIDLITRALEESGGSLVEAARLLSLSSTTLHMKLKRHGIARKSVRNRGRLRHENR